VLLSSVGSGVIYGLREQVRKAQQLGQYTLLEKIGEGGMGSVYRAQHALLRRPTALKLIRSDATGAQALARFEREVQITAELSHPNTVAIYDYGHTREGVFYYAMEYLDGFDLHTLVERFGPQPPERVVHLLMQICSALAEAHDRDLVHRDIKPANVFLCHRGGVPDVIKVLDFGLVQEIKPGDREASAEGIAGTPDYLAPEAITTPGEVGAAADVYAVGAVGYFLVTGRTLFTASTAAELLRHHLRTLPDPPSKHAAGIPEALELLLLRCLAKAPAARPPSARAIAVELQGIELEPWTHARADEWWSRHRVDRAAVDVSAATTVLDRTIEVDVHARTVAAPVASGIVANARTRGFP
jgi:serine/threonine-protein kinase